VRVALLTCTRDRLPYLIHCYDTLREYAGCDFDLYVADQGSEDDTVMWLGEQTDAHVLALGKNLGLCCALNLLLGDVFDAWDYDVIVRWDNDCELTQPETLSTVAGLALDYDMILAPRVEGLRNPPAHVGEIQVGDYVVDETSILGGIFMAVPAELYSLDGFRYDESQPPWAGDELIVPWFRARGGRAGYVREFSVNHYKTTEGQRRDIPEYFDRRVAEGGPAL